MFLTPASKGIYSHGHRTIGQCYTMTCGDLLVLLDHSSGCKSDDCHHHDACRTCRSILAHLEQQTHDNAEDECGVPGCRLVRLTIRHWGRCCRRSSCSVCKALSDIRKRRAAYHTIVCMLS